MSLYIFVTHTSWSPLLNNDISWGRKILGSGTRKEKQDSKAVDSLFDIITGSVPKED